MAKKVYLHKEIRAELGLDPGYTYDEHGNLIPYVPPEKEEKQMSEFAGIIRLTVEEYEQCIASAVDHALERITKRVGTEAEAVKVRKEKLRLALVEAGYPIPEGLNLEEWIPYIKGSDNE